jgi:hypothetical protein
MLNSLTSIGNSKGIRSYTSPPFTGSLRITQNGGFALADASINLGTGPFTIEFWVKPITDTTVTNQQTFIGFGNSGCGVVIERPNNTSQFVVAFRSSQGDYFRHHTALPTAIGFVNVIVQRDPNSNIRIWVDKYQNPFRILGQFSLSLDATSLNIGRMFKNTDGEASIPDTIITSIRVSNIERYSSTLSPIPIEQIPKEAVQDANTIIAFNFRFNAGIINSYLKSEDGNVTLINNGVTIDSLHP